MKWLSGKYHKAPSYLKYSFSRVKWHNHMKNQLPIIESLGIRISENSKVIEKKLHSVTLTHDMAPGVPMNSKN